MTKDSTQFAFEVPITIAANNFWKAWVSCQVFGLVQQMEAAT